MHYIYILRIILVVLFKKIQVLEQNTIKLITLRYNNYNNLFLYYTVCMCVQKIHPLSLLFIKCHTNYFTTSVKNLKEHSFHIHNIVPNHKHTHYYQYYIIF